MGTLPQAIIRQYSALRIIEWCGGNGGDAIIIIGFVPDVMRNLVRLKLQQHAVERFPVWDANDDNVGNSWIFR